MAMYGSVLADAVTGVTPWSRPAGLALLAAFVSNAVASIDALLAAART
jgi:hypothetical protein